MVTAVVSLSRRILEFISRCRNSGTPSGQKKTPSLLVPSTPAAATRPPVEAGVSRPLVCIHVVAVSTASDSHCDRRDSIPAWQHGARLLSRIACSLDTLREAINDTMNEDDTTAAAAAASSAENSPARARRGGRTRGNRLARSLSSCNCASYCYFSLALVLFSLGTVLTILVLDDSEQMFPNLTHMWLIGPIFISSGLMFAVKTIMYLRRETMIAYLTRQHSLLRELHLVAVEPGLLRGLQQRAASLPPPYEAVATGCDSPMCHGSTTAAAFPLLMATTEEDPPSYEEALLLIRGGSGASPATTKTLPELSPPPPSTQSPAAAPVTVITVQEDLPDR